MSNSDIQSETLGETILHVKIVSEAPYAKNVTLDILGELASTLDFTEMYRGEITVTTPSGETITSWQFGADWEDTDEEA